MSTRKEKLLQRLNPKLLEMTPKLSVVTGSEIDLCKNDNSLENGAKELMMRFFKNQDLSNKLKKNVEQNGVEVTISRAKYDENEQVCELVSEKLTLPFNKGDEVESLCERPGRKLQKLKMELQDKMSAKWEEEYKKRVSLVKSSQSTEKEGYEDEEKEEDNGSISDDSFSTSSEKPGKEDLLDEDENEDDKIDNQDNGDDVDADDEDEEVGDVQEDEEESEAEICNEDTKNDENKENVPSDNGDYVPNDAKEPDDEAFGGCSLIPAFQPGGGLLYGGSELTQYEENLPENLLSPSISLSINDSPNSKETGEETPKIKQAVLSEEERNLFSGQKELLLSLQNGNESYDLNDAFEFCSGKFPDAGEAVESSNSQLESQHFLTKASELINEINSNENSQNEVDENYEAQKNSNSKKRIIQLEDSESEGSDKEDEPEENEVIPSKVFLDDDEDDMNNAKEVGLIPGVKKSRKNLHFSDEEDEAENPENEDDNDEDPEIDENGDDETFDQRSINYDSEENEIINPKEFFEREAELSGDEVWSGDEDERGLDEFDQEEGDADNIDDGQVRSQLEKIHLRRVLDDDAREVRLIQELLFEDGDLHSEGKRRDRKFKWKNLGAFDKENEGENAKEDNGNTSEEDCAEEEQLRKLRYEKELFLMEMKNSGNLPSDDEIVDEDFQKLKVTTVKNTYKLSTTFEKRIEVTKSVSEIIEVKKPLITHNARGSFLTRNEEFLSKLAKATAGVNDNVLGPKFSKNFVFASKSPEKIDLDKSTVSKRSIEEPESCGRRVKKIKMPDPKLMNTGPSILDLLL